MTPLYTVNGHMPIGQEIPFEVRDSNGRVVFADNFPYCTVPGALGLYVRQVPRGVKGKYTVHVKLDMSPFATDTSQPSQIEL